MYTKQTNTSKYTYQEIFSYEHLLNCAYLCCKNVYWKTSVINYMLSVVSNISKTYKLLMNNKFRFGSTNEFDIYERGKKRHIKSIHIKERVVQKCICKYCLHPLFDKTLIYDNCACQKGKGLNFAINRLKGMLQKYYRRFGNQGYALIFDFSNFFNSISHKQCMKILESKIQDKQVLSVIENCLDVYSEEVVIKNGCVIDKKGLGLGSEISQCIATLIPNSIDHMIKDKYRCKYYIRYMDDGIIIHNNKDFLSNLLVEIQKEAEKLGLQLNIKKTRIVKISKQFTFLKKRISVLDNGSIIMKIDKSSITRMRRKLNKFSKKYECGKMSIKNIQDSYNSWRSFALQFNSYNTVKSMDRLFYQKFNIPFNKKGGR